VATDEAEDAIKARAHRLHRRGPLLRIELRSPETASEKSVDGLALIDTGASSSVIDMTALADLHLHPVNLAKVQMPGGIQSFPLFRAAEIHFVDAGIPPRRYPFVFGAPHMLSQGFLAILGRDFLRTGLFVYDGACGRWTLAWERSKQEVAYQDADRNGA
jgi:hypothetical protein